jgi:hypothetical protein
MARSRCHRRRRFIKAVPMPVPTDLRRRATADAAAGYAAMSDSHAGRRPRERVQSEPSAISSAPLARSHTYRPVRRASFTPACPSPAHCSSSAQVSGR